MSPKCLLCLNPLPRLWDIVIGEEEKKNYQDIYNCNKELLMGVTAVQKEFLSWNSTQESPTPFCEICFKSSEKVYRLRKQLTELKNTLESFIMKFTVQIQQRILENRSKVEGQEKNVLPFMETDEIKVEGQDKNVLPFIETDEIKVEGQDKNVLPFIETNEIKVEEECYGSEELQDDDNGVQEDFVGTEFESDPQYILPVEVILSDIKEEVCTQNNATKTDEPIVKNDYQSPKIASKNTGQQKIILSMECQRNASLNLPKVILERFELGAIKITKINLRTGSYLATKMKLRESSYLKRNRTQTTSAKSLRRRKETPDGKEYRCTICPQSFPNRQSWRDHLKTVHSGELLEQHSITHSEGLICDYCGKLFKHKIALRTHVNSQHFRPKRRPCPKCPKVFKSHGGLRIHIESVHEDSSHPCPTCGMIFRAVRYLRRHEELHKDASQRRKFICSICGKSSTRKSNHIRHEKMHNRESQKEKFHCEICDKYYRKSSDLYKHQVKKHLVVTQEVHQQECQDCGNYFVDGLQLLKHSEIGRNGRKYKCHNCKEKVMEFRTLCDRLIHYKCTHPTIKLPFICKECFCVFCTIPELQTHLEVTPCGQTNKKLNKKEGWPCSTCEKRFKFKSKLVVHERFHTGERPFRCETCGEGFVTAFPLKQHQLTHNGKCTPPIRRYVSKRYTGNKCKYDYKFKCERCDRIFVSKAGIQNHIRNEHTGERPFICTTCGASFASRNPLVLHELKHRGEHNTCCHICGKSILRHNLNAHMKTHSETKQKRSRKKTKNEEECILGQ